MSPKSPTSPKSPLITVGGISPKVFNPTVCLAVVGVLVLIIGISADDSDVKSAGIACVLAALGVGGVGYASHPGTVAAKPVAKPRL